MKKQATKPPGKLNSTGRGQVFGSAEEAMQAARKRGEDSITFRLGAGGSGPSPSGTQVYGSAAEAMKAAFAQGEPSIKFKLKG